MKKILTLATAALLITGAAFAGEGKKCDGHKGCCKKGQKEMKKADKPAANDAKKA